MDIRKNEKLVCPDSDRLLYSGRIDYSNPQSPIFIFPGSSVSMMFKGRSIKVLIRNKHSYYDNYIGFIIDGVQKKVVLSNDSNIMEIMIADNLEEDKLHEVVLFKRQDGCHEFVFFGFVISEEGEVMTSSKRFKRRMEFYGDSAAAGELVEDIDYSVVPESKHNGEFTNAWYSYAMMTARNLKADVNIIAQGGIALMDKSGYFHLPESIGMESIYDKLHFNPELGKITDWDFKAYIPHIVIIDIGQYDAVPVNYMKEDKDGDSSLKWRKHYRDFVISIREKYPNAFIILTTTIMNHHPSWDRAIGLICRELNDKKILHFLYSCNGCGTPFGIRMSEAEQMAFELSMFIKGLEPMIWEE